MNVTVDVLSKRSVDSAIKQLQDWKRDFNKRLEKFFSRLEEEGLNAVRANVSGISPIYKGDDIGVTSHKLENGFSIEMYGEHVAFIEFGSGITFNSPVGTSKHPKGERMGLTIGSYNPSSKNASSPTGWWFTNRWGESEHTYGTPTFSPLYDGELELIGRIREIANEVFGQK